MIITRSYLVDLEADISQLQAPTFTTINRGPPEPMLHLTWNLPVNLIGEKVLNPMIHCCDKCLKPILIYGRLVRTHQTKKKTPNICSSNISAESLIDSLQTCVLPRLWKARRTSTVSEMSRKSGSSGTD